MDKYKENKVKYNEVLEKLVDKTIFLKAHVRAALVDKRTITRFKGNLSTYWFYSAGRKIDLEISPPKYKKWLDDYNRIVENMLLHFEFCPPGNGYLKAQSNYNNLKNSLEEGKIDQI